MAKVNIPRKPIYTHEGAKATHINPELQLRRSVMSCMLWEKSFYENGEDIAVRIQSLVSQVPPEKCSEIAIEARAKMKLRHAPLLIAREMARINTHKPFVADVLGSIIQRADELSEFVAMYWMHGKQPLSGQVKKGLARAFQKFDAYQLAKYNRDGAVKLRDVLFLSHAKPKDKEQEAVWKKLVDGTLEPPDTWEVGLSSGQDKKGTWERLLKENKLGAMALLRNLRNMIQAGVGKPLMSESMQKCDVGRVLPFRFLSAAKFAVDFEPQIEEAFLRCCSTQNKIPGKTILIVDVSGSMYGRPVSAKSTMDRAQAACALAVLVREICEDPYIYATAGDDGRRIHATQKVPARRGFALSDAIYNLCRPLGGGGIFLKQVMDFVFKAEGYADRVIVITDEQDCGLGSADSPLKANAFGKTNYLINVSVERNGIGYDKWTHIDGWSEAVVDYIRSSEMVPS